MDRNPDDRDSPFFKNVFRDPIYETLFAIALENLTTIPVVITGPFTSEKANPLWRQELANRFQAPVEIHYISCSAETLKARILQRRNPRDAAKLENWDEYIRYHDASLPLYEHTLILN